MILKHCPAQKTKKPLDPPQEQKKKCGKQICRKCNINEREDFGNLGLSYYCKECLHEDWESEYFNFNFLDIKSTSRKCIASGIIVFIHKNLCSSLPHVNSLVVVVVVLGETAGFDAILIESMDGSHLQKVLKK